MKTWRVGDKVRRFWQHDASLWTGTDEAKWMGWLDITAQQIAHSDKLQAAVADVKKENFTDILLLGMGGSSLCPDVLAMTFGRIAGFPQLHVLDSTDPAQVKAAENKVNLARTLFIVSSKSGTTLEPNIFKQYFFERVKQTIGADKAGSRFIAITDPGSKMQQVAEADHFRHIFPGLPSIGGRYSALSNFGVVPGALMGLDMGRFLARTQEMVEACGAAVPVEQNPGALLGIVLGTAARSGRDKLTLIASPGISALGAWLEQLVAESTGKQGKGIVPVDREDLGLAEVYGNDRMFAYVRLESAPDKAQDARVAALEQAGQPVVRIPLGDIYDLGQEFFRWEIATAIVGSIIEINPFNQPDVEASKIATRNLTTEYEKTGSLPAEKPVLEDGGIKLFTDAVNAEALAKAAGSDKTLARISARSHQARGCRRLLCPAGLHRDERQARSAFAEIAPGLARPEASGDLSRIRTALPSFHGPGLQGRTEQRRHSADHLRRCRRPARARADVHFWRGQSSAGPGRLPGAGGTWTPGIAGPSGQRPGSRPRAAVGRVSPSSNLIVVPGYYTGLHYGRRKQWRWAIETI